MKRTLAAIAFCTLAAPTLAQDTEAEFETCSLTPIDQVGFVETFTTPGECETACLETEGCDSWTFRPHSFDASMPGQCKLIAGIFAEEDSTSTYCGKL